MSSAAPEMEDSDPVNLLSLDGGGIRGLSELIILHEIMKRIQYDLKLPELPRPCDYFHLIGGTSTGGLIALMLGRFRMTMDEALQEYNKLASKMFSETKWGFQKSRFKAKNLEDAIKSIIQTKGTSGDPDERMFSPTQDEQALGKVFVCAVPTINMARPRRFRTYEARNNAGPNCKTWEAARATAATPTIFKRIKIAELGHIRESFVNAGVRCNNPTWEVIKEARNVFGDDRYIGCILSIGTGHSDTIGLSKTGRFERLLPTKLINVLKQIAIDCENVAKELENHFLNAPNLYFRFNVQHGAGAIWEEWEKVDEIKTHTFSYLEDRDGSVDAIVEALTDWKSSAATSATRRRLTLAQISGEIPPPLPPSPPVSRYKPRPCPSSSFVGRKYFLDELWKHFAPRAPESRKRRAMLLHGIGGAGKTQICLRFVAECQDLFSYIFWVDASSRETIGKSFQDIALAESLAESSAEVGETVEVVRKWMASIQEDWLLIFDNADGNPDVIARFLPPGGGGNIIFTSRSDSIRRYTQNFSLEVKEMEEEAAVSLLLMAANEPTPSDDVQGLARSIVRELCYLALAIDQAGAYIRNECDIGDYLEIYQERRKELLDNPEFKGPSDYGYALYGTWELSVRAIERMAADILDPRKAKTASKALEILRIFGFLHHEGINEEIFRRAAENPEKQTIKPYTAYVDHGEELEWSGLDLPMQLLQKIDGKWDSFSFKKAIQRLVSFSLVKFCVSNATYTIHPLVHSWIRERLKPKERIVRLRAATSLLDFSITWSFGSEDYKFRRDLLVHIDACREKTAKLESLKSDPSTGLGFALVYSESGRFKEAEELGKQAVEMKKRMLGVEHPDTLASMNNLAATYVQLGRWLEAEELMKLEMETFKRMLGAEHLDTLIAMNNLAATYVELGRWVEAEELMKLATETFKRVLGVEHPDTLTSMGNLASAYCNQGRWMEAEQLEKQVVEARKRVLGVEHLDTLTSMSNLAATYVELGRWMEAEELMKLVMKTFTRVLGVEHSRTLAAMNNLASTHMQLGRWVEAEELKKQVVETRKRVLGVEHLDTLTSMSNLAATYVELGRFLEAEELGKQVMETRKRVLGLEHPGTLTSMNNLASTYLQLGQLLEAEELMKQVVETFTKVLGVGHPDTLTSMNNLASTYRDQGRWVEAEKLEKQAVEIKKRVLGDEHPSTLTSMNNLASTYMQLGRWVEAEELEKQVIGTSKRVLGIGHPHTLTSMANLALGYRNQGRLLEAEELERQLMEVGRRAPSVGLSETMSVLITV